MRRNGPVLVALVVLAAAVSAGCSFRERICGSEQYPVKAVGSTTGRTCVRDGDPPPEGYVRYPQGKVPTYVDDEWDRYWSTRTLDKDGNLVER